MSVDQETSLSFLDRRRNRSSPQHGQSQGQQGRAAQGSGPHREGERGIAPRRDTTDFQVRLDAPDAVAARFPWQTAPRSPIRDSSPGSDTQRRERPGIPGDLSLAGARPRVARRRPSPSHTATASTATHAASHIAAARVAHLPAERVGNEGDAPSPALAPGHSPTLSRLTPSALGPRSVDPAHQGQDRLARPGATGADSDATRIADPCSSPRHARSPRGRGSASATAPSRAAVTGATSSRRQEPAGLADPERSERVDGERGAQLHEVCWSGAARPADLPAAVAVGAPRPAPVGALTAPAPHPGAPR